jgi:hypothetical protein
MADEYGGFTCYVEQFRYGHPARKATWLYCYGTELPELRWGRLAGRKCMALVSWCGNHVKPGERRPRVSKKIASATPIEFRDILIAMARGALQ